MIDRTLHNQPLVSICIPTYNNARFLRESLDSIVTQTYSNKEIIVSDNASTDGTKEIAYEYVKKYGVRYYKNEKNIGAEANFTRCIELANGGYIAIFHADDLYMPDMVKRQVEAFKKNPEIGAVFTMATLINSKNEMIGKIKLPVNLKNKYIYDFPEIFVAILENGNFLICPSVMVRSKLYKRLIPFDADKFGTSADLDMWLRILQPHPIVILDEYLIGYRLSNTQGSFQIGYLQTKQADFFKVMDYYLSHSSIAMGISHKTLNKYEFQRYIDNVKRAINYLIKKQPQEAKNLLVKSLSANIFFEAISNLNKLKYFIWWCTGIITLGLVYLRLGKHLGKSLYWLLYTFKRRFMGV